MRTFDIAIEHLKGIDFTAFPIEVKESDEQNLDGNLEDAIHKANEEFLADVRNDKSNDWYRNMCFMTAMLHLVFKAHGWTSFFDVACEIIEAKKDVLNTDYETYLRTSYPKVMLNEWNKYCERLKERTELIEGEINNHLFFAAYHYTIEPETA